MQDEREPIAASGAKHIPGTTGSVPTETVAGLVLAGGLSRRMGLDKAFADLAGRPLVEHALALLRPHCGPLAISANSAGEAFAAFGCAVLADEDDSRPGPLAGILAGLAFARGQGAAILLTVPVDTPFLPPEAPGRLARHLAASAALVCVARTRDGVQPLVAAWRPEAEPAIRTALGTGRRAVRDALSALACEDIVFDAPGDAAAFANLNTPQELAAARRRQAAPGGERGA